MQILKLEVLCVFIASSVFLRISDPAWQALNMHQTKVTSSESLNSYPYLFWYSCHLELYTYTDTLVHASTCTHTHTHTVLVE